MKMKMKMKMKSPSEIGHFLAVPEKWWNDETFSGTPLQFASDELKNDRKIVLAAVSKNGAALEFASETLRGDNEIVVAAVSQKARVEKFYVDLRAELQSRLEDEVSELMTLEEEEKKQQKERERTKNRVEEIEALLKDAEIDKKDIPELEEEKRVLENSLAMFEMDDD